MMIKQTTSNSSRVFLPWSWFLNVFFNASDFHPVVACGGITAVYVKFSSEPEIQVAFTSISFHTLKIGNITPTVKDFYHMHEPKIQATPNMVNRLKNGNSTQTLTVFLPEYLCFCGKQLKIALYLFCKKQYFVSCIRKLTIHCWGTVINCRAFILERMHEE